MRERLANIVMGVVIGGLVGAAAIWLLSRESGSSGPSINGHPMSYWIRALENDNATIRAEAVKALPQFGNDAIPPIIELLDEPNAQTDAVEILAKIGSPAVPALINTLEKGSTNMQLGAIKTLDRIGQPAAEATTPVVKFLGRDDLGPVAAEFVARVRPNVEAVAIAIDVLENGSTSRQLDAIKVLSRASRSDARAEAALVKASRSPAPRVRQAAFETICNLKPPPFEAVPDMIAGLEHGETLTAARVGLASLGKKAIEPLRNCVTHPSPRVRIEVITVLYQLIAEEGAAEALILFVKDPEPTVASAAAVCLETLHKRDLSTVKKQLSSPSPAVRVWAVREIGKVQPPMIDDIAPLLDDPDEAVRREAADAIRDLWTVDDPAILESPKATAMNDKLRGIRLLPFAKNTKKYDMMIAAMEDPQPRVRLAAARSLGRCLTSGRAVQRLVEALKTDTSPEVRAESAKVLANARERSGVVTALEEAARDVDQSVAQAALAALSQPLSP